MKEYRLTLNWLNVCILSKYSKIKRWNPVFDRRILKKMVESFRLLWLLWLLLLLLLLWLVYEGINNFANNSNNSNNSNNRQTGIKMDYERQLKIHENYFGDFMINHIDYHKMGQGNYDFFDDPLLRNIIQSLFGTYAIAIESSKKEIERCKELKSYLEKTL